MRPDVGFGFDDLPREIPSPQPADQNFTKKALCNLEGGSPVETVFKFHARMTEQKKRGDGLMTVASR